MRKVTYLPEPNMIKLAGCAYLRLEVNDCANWFSRDAGVRQNYIIQPIKR